MLNRNMSYLVIRYSQVESSHMAYHRLDLICFTPCLDFEDQVHNKVAINVELCFALLNTTQTGNITMLVVKFQKLLERIFFSVSFPDFPSPHTIKKAKNIKTKKNRIYQNGKATSHYKDFQRSKVQIRLLSLANSIHLLCGTKFSLRLSQLSSILQSQTVFVPQTIAHY